jgi:hypothetical protein
MGSCVAISPGPFLTPPATRDLGDNQAALDAMTKEMLLTAAATSHDRVWRPWSTRQRCCREI